MNDKLLIIGAPKVGKFKLIESLFQSLPDDVGDSHSGIIHPVDLKTKYFEIMIDLWIDETNDFAEWCREFSNDEAKEARDVINMIIFVFKFEEGLDSVERKINQLNELIDKFNENDWKGIVVGVGMDDVTDDFMEFEDLFIQQGIEMVGFKQQGSNEFGEVVGVKRLRQIIECHEWTTNGESNENENNNEVTNLDELVEKLKNAKEYIKNLDNDKDKQKYAQFIINELNI